MYCTNKTQQRNQITDFSLSTQCFDYQGKKNVHNQPNFTFTFNKKHFHNLHYVYHYAVEVYGLVLPYKLWKIYVNNDKN